MSLSHWAENQDFLDRYVLNRFSEQKMAQLDVHLGTCDSCKEKLERMKSVLLVVRDNARQELRNDLTIKLIIAKKDMKAGTRKTKSSSKQLIFLALGILLFVLILVTQLFDFIPVAIMADGQEGKYSGTTSKVTTDQKIDNDQFSKEIIASDLPEQKDSVGFIKDIYSEKKQIKEEIKRDTLNKNEEENYQNLKKVMVSKDLLNKKSVLKNFKTLKKVDIELTFVPLNDEVTLPNSIRAKFVKNQKKEISQIILFCSEESISNLDIAIFQYNKSLIIKFSNTLKFSNTETDPYTFHKL